MSFNDGLPEILPPSEDGVFKSIFTKKTGNTGEETEYFALKEILSDIIERKLIKVDIRANEPAMRDLNAKREVFDINCIAEDDKSQMDIEMQATPMEGDNSETGHMHIRNRSVFNLCDIHAGQPGRGVMYGDYCRSYQITICNYKVLPWDNKLVEFFTPRNDTGHELTGIITSIFIDLTQSNSILKKTVSEMTDVEKWVVFLAKADNPKYCEIINNIVQSKAGIHMAHENLTSISKDEDERARFRSRRIWENDRAHERAFWEQQLRQAQQEERMKWENALASKDVALANKDAYIAELLEKLKNNGQHHV